MPPPTADDIDLTCELEPIIARFEQVWNAKDFAGLRALWDADLAEPVYIAEETDRIIGWEALERYWADCDRVIDLVHIKPRDLVCRRLGTDTALAAFVMHVHWLEVNADVPASNPEVRVSMILRRRGDAWKIVHHVEAPLGALPLVMRVYQGAVTPEFAELARARCAERV